MSLLLFDNFLTRMSRKRNYEGFTHISQSVYVTCNFSSCLIETEWLLEIAGSRVQCKSGDISKTVQDRHVNCYYRPLIEVITACWTANE